MAEVAALGAARACVAAVRGTSGLARHLSVVGSRTSEVTHAAAVLLRMLAVAGAASGGHVLERVARGRSSGSGAGRSFSRSERGGREDGEDSDLSEHLEDLHGWLRLELGR